MSLADRQLTLKVEQKRSELDEIMALDNPTVKKTLLISFADKCDSLAIDLKAAPFRGQQSCVLMPCNDLKDNECYCPAYKDGTKLALVRYPYAGPYESPLLTVRNTGSPAEKLFPKTSIDAIAVNSNKLGQMSGADTDGDVALCIPQTPSSKLYTKPDTLPELKGFDPKESFPGYKGMPIIKHQTQQTEMGKVTNLIQDMYQKLAPEEDQAKAAKHSMVVIDSEKHGLNWKQSEIDNDILALKHKYQDTGDGKTGAGTIITRAGSEIMVNERKPWQPSANSIDAEGNKKYEYTGNTYKEGKLSLKGLQLEGIGKVNLTYDTDSRSLYYLKRDSETKKNIRVYIEDSKLPESLRGVNIKSGGWVYLNDDKKTGQSYYLRTDFTTGKNVRQYVNDGDIVETKVSPRQEKSTRMAEEKDPYKLTSGGSKENPGYPMEKVYARFATDMKDLAREARKAYLKVGGLKHSKEAAVQYEDEVSSLNKKLSNARANAPYERQAQLMAGRTMAIKKYENPNMTNEQKKKMQGQAITAARTKIGAKKPLIEIEPNEYKAIQAGAITETKLLAIMNNCNLDSLKAHATPRNAHVMDNAKIARAKAMAAKDIPIADIAEALGFSTSTVSKALK